MSNSFIPQAAILLLFNLGSMLLVFPAMISLDLRRRSAARSDLLCCLTPESPMPKRNKVADRSRGRSGKTDKVCNKVISKYHYLIIETIHS